MNKKKKVYDVIIVGAGPAGMTTALYCAGKNMHVLVIEKNDLVGRKILSTGNGKCNLTNLSQKPEYYRSNLPKKAWQIIQNYDEHDTIDFLKRIGIYTRQKQGYIYPYNEQAATVREAFEAALVRHPGIELCLGKKVLDINRMSKENHTKQRFKVTTASECYFSRYLVISTGGLAAPKLGSEGDGFIFAKHTGHKTVLPLPALTPLKSGAPFLKKLSGVRNQAVITLVINGEEKASEKGELQWTDYGISGVAVFQLSRYAITALEDRKKVQLKMDFVPDFSDKEFFDILIEEQKNCPYLSARLALQGFLPGKLTPVVLREAKINGEDQLSFFNGTNIRDLVKSTKGFILNIQGYVGYEKAQVTRGGVSLAELSSSLESLICPGLYFAGEVADVDGACGGYNLQWAFSSGMAVGNDLCLKRKGADL